MANILKTVTNAFRPALEDLEREIQGLQGERRKVVQTLSSGDASVDDLQAVLTRRDAIDLRLQALKTKAAGLQGQQRQEDADRRRAEAAAKREKANELTPDTITALILARRNLLKSHLLLEEARGTEYPTLDARAQHASAFVNHFFHYNLAKEVDRLLVRLSPDEFVIDSHRDAQGPVLQRNGAIVE